MNTIGMHRIKRALLQNFAWLPFAVAPHPLAFDALPPPPSFCPPPLVRCAPGDMQKTKSYLRQLERKELDKYAQNQESVTAELCMVTFLLLLLIHLLLMLCRLRLLSVRLLSFGALLATCNKQNPISVDWKEMNTIRMHKIERAVLQKFAWLPFAVAPHPLAFDALPPPPFFCPPPLVRCAPGDMQKTKSDLRQLQRNEHDTYAQNRESGTAEICMVTFCCCSSSTCF